MLFFAQNPLDETQPGIHRLSCYYKPRRHRRSPEGDGRERAMHVVNEVRLGMALRRRAQDPRRASLPHGRRGRRVAPLRGGPHGGDERAAGVPEVQPAKPAKKAVRHPYLLINKPIRFPSQVRGIGIAYIPIGRAHMYLTCVIDWHSRLVVAWRLVDGMSAAGVCACVEAAFAEHGTPSILNSDQGSVFSSAVYEVLLASNHVLQGMDSGAHWADNVILESVLRSLKSDCVRIGEYETPAELRKLVVGYVESSSITASVRTSRRAAKRRPSGTIRGWWLPMCRRYRTRAHFRPKTLCPIKRATLSLALN